MTSAAAALQKTCPRCGSKFGTDAVFCPRDGARLEPHDSAPPPEPPDPYIGTVIAGDIEIRSVAGVGAMGRVYRAHQKGIDRDVAVKILHRELSSNQQLVQRFNREAKIASKLQHPHVVEVYLAGQLHDGALYIVMEYLDGMSLAAALTAGGGKLPIERALSITLQICDAVGEGHTRGIIHRDLKPENVMLVHRADSPEWVKVLDFGIARVNLGEQSMETAAGLIFGTARYISPEGAQGAKVGPQGDVYAITTMLFQMLSGRTPFDGEPLGMLVKHIHEAPPNLRTVAPEVPEAIVAVVMQNLAKEPSHRAATARVLGAQLTQAARQAAISISDVGVIARMSQLPEQPAHHVNALEPTLDDAANVAAPALRKTTEAAAPLESALPPPPKAEAEARQPPKRSWGLVVVLVAFLVGVGGTIAATRIAGRGDAEHAAYIEHVRGVLADGHYVAPPGENVKELVAAGLARWPKDAQLAQLRSEAEHEMITMAMAAHSSGDVVGARNLSRDAYGLDPTDNSARYMRGQAEDELDAIQNGVGLASGSPRLVFESPPVVKPGQKVDITCKIIAGQAGPKAKIGNIRLTLRPNGQSTGGTPVSLSAPEPTLIRASLVAPGVGSYDVAFEASVDGTVVRAMRDLDVAP